MLERALELIKTLYNVSIEISPVFQVFWEATSSDLYSFNPRIRIFKQMIEETIKLLLEEYLHILAIQNINFNYLYLDIRFSYSKKPDRYNVSILYCYLAGKDKLGNNVILTFGVFGTSETRPRSTISRPFSLDFYVSYIMTDLMITYLIAPFVQANIEGDEIAKFLEETCPETLKPQLETVFGVTLTGSKNGITITVNASRSFSTKEQEIAEIVRNWVKHPTALMLIPIVEKLKKRLDEKFREVRDRTFKRSKK